MYFLTYFPLQQVGVGVVVVLPYPFLRGATNGPLCCFSYSDAFAALSPLQVVVVEVMERRRGRGHSPHLLLFLRIMDCVFLRRHRGYKIMYVKLCKHTEPCYSPCFCNIVITSNTSYTIEHGHHMHTRNVNT